MLRFCIALARAVYGMPRLVLLDEPNASLDDDGEQALAAAIDALGIRLRSFAEFSGRGTGG